MEYLTILKMNTSDLASWNITDDINSIYQDIDSINREYHNSVIMIEDKADTQIRKFHNDGGPDVRSKMDKVIDITEKAKQKIHAETNRQLYMRYDEISLITATGGSIQ